MTRNKVKGVLFFVVLIVVAVVLYASAHADTVPVNGGLVGNLTGWNCYPVGGGNCEAGWLSSNGGSAFPVFASNTVMASSPFIVGIASELSFSRRCVSGTFIHVGVFDYDNHAVSDVYTETVTDTGSYQTVTADLSSYSGQIVSLYVYGSSSCYGMGQFVVSNAINVGEGYYNGEFDANGSGWASNFCGGCGGGSAVYVGGDGHSNNGALNVNGAHVLSLPFQGLGETWSVWVKGDADTEIYIAIFDWSSLSTGGAVLVSTSHNNLTGWSQFNYDLSSYGSHLLSWEIYGLAGGGSVLVDDICPDTSDCTALPTPTSLPTMTFTPSATLMASSTPIPTNTLGPTPTAGAGGGGGSNNNCPPSDPCYVIVLEAPTGLPFPTQIPPLTQLPYLTQIPYPTPLYGLNTPAPVYVPTPDFTPVSGDPGGISLDGGPVAVASDTDFSNPPPIVLGGGSSTFPVQVGMSIQNLTLCLPEQVRQAVNLSDLCSSIFLPVIPYLRVGTVDMTIYFAAIGAVIFFVFIARQIQEH